MIKGIYRNVVDLPYKSIELHNKHHMINEKITTEQWIGLDTQPNCSIELRAGVLTAEFTHGRLMHVAYDERCLIDEIYFALRDANWGTVPYIISNLNIEKSERSFRITFCGEHDQNGIIYSWNAEIIGTADSKIEYSFKGKSKADFLRNRIGFCVLHPASFSGEQCVIEHSGSQEEIGIFPDHIAPFQPFKDISAITSFADSEHELKVEFSGDVFEMEDQRNWTDASYKTYCTPLDEPFPVPVKIGDSISQRVSLSFVKSNKRIKTERKKVQSKTGGIRLQEKSFSLGSRMTEPLDAYQLRRISDLQLSHICCEYDFSDSPKAFIEMLMQVKQIGADLRLTVFFTDDWHDEVKELLRILNDIPCCLAAITVFQKDVKVIPEDIFIHIRDELRVTGAKIGTGTNGYFTQINRERLTHHGADFISYANTPQVHAFDCDSIMTTTDGQIANIESCGALYPDTSIWINPLTMKIRWNPDATGEEIRLAGECPKDVDNRQMSLFAACWFIRSMAACIGAGARGATCFELTGSKGIMENSGITRDYYFPSVENMLFPLYFAFYALRGIGRCCINTDVRNQSAAIMLDDGKTKRVIIANCSKDSISVDCDLIPEGLNGVVVDEHNVAWLSQRKSVDEIEKCRKVYKTAGGAMVLTGYAIFFGEIQY